MAICESATRFDNDSYYRTMVDEENSTARIIGTNNGEPVDWEVGGGGGGSDFSTATVTLINTDTSTQYFFRADSIQNDGIKETTVSVGEPVEVEIPLYKGNHTITIMSIASNDMEVMPTGTGGVTVDMPNMSIIITGDGTLTAKGMPVS